MEVQPPWASELLARNRKVARNICWSTSVDSSSASSSFELRINGNSHHRHHHHLGDGISNEGGGGGGDVLILRNTIVVKEGAGGGEVDIGGGGKGTLVKGVEAAKILRITSKDEGKVVDPLLIEAYNNSRTDSSSDGGDNDGAMKEKNGDPDSGFEYGPGIVMKLRSKYQSLALRQSMGRPTLRRSASLENCLDQGCDNLTIVGGTPSPTPRYNKNNAEDEVDGRSRRSENRSNNYHNNAAMNGDGRKMTGNNVTIQQQHYQQRGRSSGHSDFNNRDRMRRARSVDALHRSSNRQSEEKEILEKFKHVVLPKEEIVIIEVSSTNPRSNFGNNIYASDSAERQGQFSRSLQINGNGGYENSSELLNRVRSLASPEHELPPPDIVRETARIFEKNQENQSDHHHNNNQQNNNSGSQHINGFKKVGHALRLSKGNNNCVNSATGGGVGSANSSSSPLPSPTATSGVVHTSGSMNGQGGSPYQVQNKGHLSAQGLNTCASNSSSSSNSLSASHQKGNKLGDGRSSSNNNHHNNISNGHSTPSVNSVASSANNNQQQSNNNYSSSSNISATKQVGVIRPTVTTTNTTSSSSAPVINGHIAKRNPTNKSPAPSSTSSASLSGSSSVKAMEDSGSSINGGSTSAKKPPLGPKPLLSSASNNIFLKNDKTVVSSSTSSSSSNMTESSNNSSSVSGNQSPEPSNSERVRSPTSPPASSASPIEGLRSFPLNKSFEIPLAEEENNEAALEFLQITLKPVAKPKDHSEIIVNTSEKSFTKPTSKESSLSNKTEKKDQQKIVSSTNNNNATITKGSSTQNKPSSTHQKAPPPPQPQQQVPLRKTPSPTLPKEVPKEEVKQPPPPPQQQQQQQQTLSQLRSHQQQKLQKNTGGGETMVFNFTNRQKVPDYIEDDGLHRVKVRLSGTVTDESHDDTDDGELLADSNDYVDAKMYQFEGANVIINGRSSIQKKPKSQKLNISFNEDGPITFEYPSEASVLGDDEDATDYNKENPLGHKTPNILGSGSGLGSYTPSKIGNSYQLGSYTDRNLMPAKRSQHQQQERKSEDITNEFIEDYLKPDSGSTTWSNEIGADILF